MEIDPGSIVPSEEKSAWGSIKIPNFRLFLLSNIFFTLAGRALAVVIGFQIYSITRTAISLGALGLVEAVPALALVLYGGHLSDRKDRRKILLVTTAVSVLCGGLFVYFSTDAERFGVFSLYCLIFVIGIARGFADPARTALEAQIIPRPLMMNASTWSASVWMICAIIGPALGGLAYGYLGPVWTYSFISAGFLLAWLAVFLIPSHPLKSIPKEESVVKSIAEGVKFVWNHEILLSSMTLDLFAVLFGGATALFPIFAADILKVGPQGLGLLAAAPAVGSLIALIWAMKRPPKEHAGMSLMLSVAGFGISMIVFGLSTSFVLSLISLVFSGAFDGVSVVVRRSIIRLMSPDHMRGRIASVGWIFIGSSNEIGAFESGVIASLIGAAPAVWTGGILTLLVVAAVYKRTPNLRKLRLE